MTIDWTSLALQTINVLVLLWLLQRFLYRPVLAVLERRQTEIGERLAKAETARLEAEAAKTEIAAEHASLASQREQRLAQVQAEAEAARAARMQDVAVQSARLLDEAQHQIERERAEAETQLREDAATLAADFAARILERVPAGVLTRAYLEELTTQKEALQALGASELRVVSASPLAEDETTAIQARLSPLLAHPVQWRFEVDESLIAGLAVHADDSVIAHSLAQDLTQLKAAALEHDTV
ncbi:F0F1 ATP synthase subunit delta [Algiphilus sp. W345]|uniref:ATP synthase subunit b n=1 Tax=Banduia mediterranea TaxID=3075609 RepID=A0ABU2WI11_9GAMM|nr:F0F1 ATP synthase subunit delta [Algiphilus sp. W345]MDT0497509.1 F0F1 ATP synthase subunit delta [Algiphilus sp. W345]